jgi:pimeloyl-ACP methyl ester carboxylesterase
MDSSTPLDFARRSLGIDARAFDDSGFSSHFRGRPADAVEYFEHLASCTWAGDAATARATAYSAMLRAALDVDLESTAVQNQIPTDLVWGEEDRVFPSRIYARYARTLGASKLHLLPGVGHFAPLEASGALAAILARRIAEL